jgi:hypothetical protein
LVVDRSTGSGVSVSRRASRRIAVSSAFILLLGAQVLGSSAVQTVSASVVPVVSAVTPGNGPVSGGTTVYIIGSGFTGATGVKFGTLNASFVVDSDNQIHATTPAASIGAGGSGPTTVDVRVQGPGGTSAASGADRFTFQPIITTVSPNAGLATGGTSVILTGSGFTWSDGTTHNASQVCFGKTGSSCNAAISFTVTSDSSITATSPPGAPGVVTVYVVVNGIQSIDNGAANQYAYTTTPAASAPSISNVSVHCCVAGKTVTITGTNFNGDVHVYFGFAGCSQAQSSATFTKDVTGTMITATAPDHAAATVDIVVTNDIGSSGCNPGTDAYTFNLPALSAIGPNVGPSQGGTSVKIDGTVGTDAFNTDPRQGTDTFNGQVFFGNLLACGPCTTQTNSNSTVSIVTKSPPHAAGAVTVTAATSAGTSTSNQTYSYFAFRPVVQSLAPTRGPSRIRIPVVITGQNFTAATSVSFGANSVSCPSADCSLDGDTQITANDPTHVPGIVDVTVTTGGGTSDPTHDDTGCPSKTPCAQFTYYMRPAGQQLTVSNTDGRLEAFGFGANRQIYHAWQSTPNSSFTAWYSLGGPPSGQFISDPAAGRNADGRIETFAVGDDGNLYHIWQTSPGGGWTAFYSLGRPGTTALTAVPSIATNTDGRLEIFAVGADGAVWHTWQWSGGAGWSNWYSLGAPGGGQFVGNVAAGRNGDGRLEIAVVDNAGAMWHSWQWSPSGGWSAFYSLGHPAAGPLVVGTPGEGTNADGRLEIVVHGSDNAVWHIWQTTPSGGWGAYYSLGGDDVSDPNIARNGDGRLEAFFITSAGKVSHTWQTSPGGGWIGPFDLTSNGTVLSGTPQAATNLDGRVEVIALNQDQTMQDNHQDVPSGGWVGWSLLPGTTFQLY